MIERAHIAQILRLNGIDIEAPPEQIKSILLSAKWHEDDVETALTVLREDPNDQQRHVETIHKVFRSDQRLNPETISSLLGIDVELSSQDIALRRKHARGDLTSGIILHMLMMALVLSTLLIIGSMWLLKVGIFHQSVAAY